MKTTYFSFFATFILALAAFCMPTQMRADITAHPDGADATNFTLVIDAGHGGHDSGAVGTVAKEKTINLNVALALGKLIEQNCPDVKVVYTRKTDVFIALQERANIANRNKADLFISIHTNAVASNKGGVYGAETYTLGMHRAADNLEVAKRENSVITMEADYKTKYQGFDPNKAESYIIFELMQDKHMAKSVKLANAIQKQYASAGRKNKGVHQAGFLVLRQTSMPSVLTELGFISNPTEEKFLNSTDGVNKLARSIYDGFCAYRKQLAYGGEEGTETAPSVPLLAENSTSAAAANASSNADAPITASPSTNEAAASTPINDIAGSAAIVNERIEGATPSPARPIDEDVTPSVRPVTTTPYPIKTNTPKENATPASTASGKKPSEIKAEEKVEQKPAETNNAPAAAEQKPIVEQKPAEPKAEQKPAEAKTEKPAEPIAEQKPAEPQPAPETAPGKPVFKIQLLTCAALLKTGDARLKGLPAEYYMDGATYKYTYGSTTNYDEIVSLKKTIADKFPGVFIIALVDGKRIDLQEAIQISKKN